VTATTSAERTERIVLEGGTHHDCSLLVDPTQRELTLGGAGLPSGLLACYQPQPGLPGIWRLVGYRATQPDPPPSSGGEGP
jgi:hypothetical protein